MACWGHQFPVRWLDSLLFGDFLEKTVLLCSVHICEHHWPQHFSMACLRAKSLSRVWLFATLWTVAFQAPLSMGFSRQEFWSELPCPLPGDLPDPGIEPTSLKSLALAGGFFTTKATWEARSVWHGPIIPQSYSHTAWLLLNSLIGTSTPRGWMWTNRKGIIQGFSHKEMSKGVGRTCRNENNFLNLALCSLSSG